MKHADARPRIHIWTAGDRWTWSKGPAGIRSAGFTSPGFALDAALSFIGRQPAVVIMEPSNG